MDWTLSQRDPTPRPKALYQSLLSELWKEFRYLAVRDSMVRAYLGLPWLSRYHFVMILML